jgi:hypothetical protein
MLHIPTFFQPKTLTNSEKQATKHTNKEYKKSTKRTR